MGDVSPDLGHARYGKSICTLALENQGLMHVHEMSAQANQEENFSPKLELAMKQLPSKKKQKKTKVSSLIYLHRL